MLPKGLLLALLALLFVGVAEPARATGPVAPAAVCVAPSVVTLSAVPSYVVVPSAIVQPLQVHVAATQVVRAAAIRPRVLSSRIVQRSVFRSRF